MPILPTTKVPALNVSLVAGGSWSLADSTASSFTMVIFYRGYHCPKCKEQLLDVQERLADIEAKGAQVIAVSMDPQDRAESTRDEWGLPRLNLGYGLSKQAARGWGLFMSSSRGKTSLGIEELKVFNEPGLFLVRPPAHDDASTLYASWVQTTPFARPPVNDLLALMNFANEKSYPPRGILAA
jgi:peroxiredoxin